MPTEIFTSGRIRKAENDASSGLLGLHWDNGTVTAYKQVPQEVYRRLCSAPNPASYCAYFSPSWTAFQAERGRDFSVIVDGISN